MHDPTARLFPISCQLNKMSFEPIPRNMNVEIIHEILGKNKFDGECNVKCFE